MLRNIFVTETDQVVVGYSLWLVFLRYLVYWLIAHCFISCVIWKPNRWTINLVEFGNIIDEFELDHNIKKTLKNIYLLKGDDAVDHSIVTRCGH